MRHLFYCPSPCVDYPDGGLGLVLGEWVEGYLWCMASCGMREHCMFLRVGMFSVLVECVVELRVRPVLVYSLSV